MKNILILANGDIAKHFVQWVGKSRIDDNHYYITCSNVHATSSPPLVENLTFIDADPTSFIRLKHIMEERDFTMAFIVMNEREESLYALKNIRKLTAKLLVIFLSKWDNLTLDDDNLSLLNVNEIVAGNLYEKLPNVPIIAQNIGLGRGEIMEILIPFGSSFAYRHVGAISHRKWRIIAIYRKGKQLFPNNATMLLPNDRLVVVGNPIVLEEVYKRINKRQGVFPEPFGKNLYLIVDMNHKKEEMLLQINEAIFLSNQLIKTKLFIRLIHICDLEMIDEVRSLETPNISVMVTYNPDNILTDIDYDVSQYDIGLFLVSDQQFFKKNFKKYLYGLMRPIYIFGDKSLYNIEKAVILMGEDAEMESLSTSVFDFSESLSLKLSLCNYNPEGDFEDRDHIVEHYESLSRLYNFKITIDKKRVNPIRELIKHDDVLHITSFTKKASDVSFIDLILRKFTLYFLSVKKHPQLLIPVDN